MGNDTVNESQFLNWLCEKYTRGTPNSRLSNCKRVEQYEGDLDSHFAENQGFSLIEKLSYSKDDKRNNRKPKHAVPINGDIYNGTATLKQAINLYFEYKSGSNLAKSNRYTGQIIRRITKEWPIWEHPSDKELYEIIKLSARYIKFLNPDIIREIVIDNQKHQTEWSQRLIDNKVNPDIYLWKNSPCAFPGVRRYAGSKEIAYFRKHAELSNDEINGALKLDDNDFPKHIWSFIFRGNKFQKNGPNNYSLAHLADHKEYKNRRSKEFLVKPINQSHELYGLFTCPTNTAYIPSSLLRPTDFSPAIRKLLISKAHDLYGHFCNILPPWIKLISCSTDKWDHTHFQWSDPVGDIDNIKLFLDFRNETMKSIFTI
jgi:hypothetical protein